MKLEKKQVPLLAGLCVVTLGAVGYAGFSLIGGHGPRPAAAAVPKGKTAAKPAMTPTDKAAAALLALVPSFREDPFRPALAPEAPAGAGGAKPSATPKASTPVGVAVHEKAQGGEAASQAPPLPAAMVAAPAPGTVSPLVGPRTTAQVVPSGANPAGGPKSASNGGPAPSARPPFELAGIIVGDHPVAILRSGDKERQVVQEQDIVAGRYRVAAITATGIVLESGKERWRLGTGQQ